MTVGYAVGWGRKVRQRRRWLDGVGKRRTGLAVRQAGSKLHCGMG